MGILFDQNVRVIIQDRDGLQEAVEFPIISGYTIEKTVSFANARSSKDTMDLNGDRKPGKTYTGEITPAKFSFTTYVEWDDSSSEVKTPQDLLWQGLVGNSSASSATPTELTIDFSESNVVSLLPLKVWFQWKNESTQAYFDNVIVDSAEIDINIENIATIQWNCTALGDYTFQTTNPPPAATQYSVGNCLINKYSTTDLTWFGIPITLPLTGGRILFENNNEYFTRIELGNPTTTKGHIPGVLRISGSLKAYLVKSVFGNVAGVFASMQNALILQQYNLSDTNAELKLNIGGSSSDNSILQFDSQPSSGDTTIFLKFPSVEPGDSLTLNIDFETKDSNNYPILKYIT